MWKIIIIYSLLIDLTQKEICEYFNIKTLQSIDFLRDSLARFYDVFWPKYDYLDVSMFLFE